jgi:hypothetical protein
MFPLLNEFVLWKQYLSFPRKRESSFFALNPCFRRGDIVGFFFPKQVIISFFLNKMHFLLLRDRSFLSTIFQDEGIFCSGKLVSN